MVHIKKLLILFAVVGGLFFSFLGYQHFSKPAVNLEYLTEHTFSVSGMTCQSCSAKIQGYLGRQTGIISVEANHESGAVKVAYDASKVSIGQIKGYLKTLGYTVNQQSDVEVIDYSIQYN